MKWMIYKENSNDLGFVLSCFFSQAITMNEFKKWLDIVIMDTPTNELPNYFFDLVDFNQANFHLTNVIGFSPSNEGIAYIRKVRPLIDMSVKEETALKALQNNPQILERFKKFFPFVQI